VSTRPLRLPVALPRITRVERDRVLAGVCSGVGEALAMDATLVRLTFAVLSFASGAGIVAYLGAWALLPAPGEPTPARKRRIAGTVLLVWSVILALRGLGLSDSLVWPLALIGAGAALATGATTLGLDRRRARITAIVLTVLGIAIFIGSSRHGSATTLLAPGAIAAALILLLGPWAWRRGRERDAERAERIRSQERADFAARVHDSVLQTLALIQRHPDDPRRVATLARRQERELRAWLYPDREPAAEGTLADAVETAAAEIEELHGIRIEVVRTGDAPLDDRTRVLVLAAREAMTNAAKHSGAEEISVFVEAGPGRIALYVRDRGSGFEPASVAEDRKGISESIRGRMQRVGGTATIVSSPGEGTDVELELA
jgi:signal transduction histidine kinase